MRHLIRLAPALLAALAACARKASSARPGLSFGVCIVVSYREPAVAWQPNSDWVSWALQPLMPNTDPRSAPDSGPKRVSSRNVPKRWMVGFSYIVPPRVVNGPGGQPGRIVDAAHLASRPPP